MNVLHSCNRFAHCLVVVEKVVFDSCKYLMREGITADVASLNKCHDSGEILKPFETAEGMAVAV